MKHFGMIGLAAAFTVAGASLASAQEAFTTGDINMRAGPSTQFPVVATIPEGRPVEIHGCLANFDWCDVSWRRERGWVFSDYLEYVYRQRPVEFYEYRRRVGLPVISFNFGYWDRHYRNRAWFDDWDYWGNDRRRARARGDDRRDFDRRDWDPDDGDNQARNRNRSRDDDNIDRTGSTSRFADECFDDAGNNTCDNSNSSNRTRRVNRDNDDEMNRGGRTIRPDFNDGFSGGQDNND